MRETALMNSCLGFQVNDFFCSSLDVPIAQIIQNRCLQALDYRLFTVQKIEYVYFILAFLEPASRNEQCLLWTYLPETSDFVSVHPDKALSPRAHIQESISCLVNLELRLPVGRSMTLTFNVSEFAG